MKPQELAPDARPRQTSPAEVEVLYAEPRLNKESKEVRDIQKAKPPQGGGLNGGVQEQGSANFPDNPISDCGFSTSLTVRSRKNAFVRTGEVHLGLAHRNHVGLALGANPNNPAASFCRYFEGETEP